MLCLANTTSLLNLIMLNGTVHPTYISAVMVHTTLVNVWLTKGPFTL